MSCVEAFVTGIKIESGNQSAFGGWSRDQGSLRVPKINRSRMYCCSLTFDPWKSSDQESSALFADHDHSHNRFNRQHISDYPLQQDAVLIADMQWLLVKAVIKSIALLWCKTAHVVFLHTSAAKRQAHWSKIPVVRGVAFQSSALAHCSTLLPC